MACRLTTQIAGSFPTMIADELHAFVMTTFTCNVPRGALVAIGDINFSTSLDQCKQCIVMSVPSRFMNRIRACCAEIRCFGVYFGIAFDKCSDAVGMTVHCCLIERTGSFQVSLVYVCTQLDKGFDALHMPVACRHVNRCGSRVGRVVDVSLHRGQHADTLRMPELSSKPHSRHAVTPFLVDTSPCESYCTQHLPPPPFRCRAHELCLL
mmetsp:Transcript_37136/g.77645  ORF Transcript_37136/g.77645 Transcript_37136/m.77645 type:complete len:209 (+) Transcript_37136:1543-2169(+)